VESSVSTSDALVRPWRTATVVASAVAIVELMALLAIGVVLLGPPLVDWARGSSEHAGATPSATKRAVAVTRPVDAPRKAGPPKLARTETSVLVLNGNGIAGAAAAEASLVQRKGYVLADIGNAPRSDYARSIVMYRPGYRAEAARLGRDLRIAIVSPLDGLRRGDLMGAHVAVVIGSR
jgi:hypothetical protein